MNYLIENYLALFLIVSLGMLIGRISVRGISLDNSAIVFVAIILGHFGLQVSDDFQKLGLFIFIFTIGIQAGPGFFESFKSYGKQLIITAFSIVFSAALLTALAAKLFHLNSDLAAGLFTGALTSTTGLAAAIESSKSTIASLGYSAVYPFGVIGVILFVRIVPKMLHMNIKKEEEKYTEMLDHDYPRIINAILKVDNVNLDGKLIKDISITTMTGVNISRIEHGGEVFVPKRDTCIRLGDYVKIVGTQEAIEKAKQLIGEAVDRELEFTGKYSVTRLMVTNKDIINKSLQELNLPEKYGITVTRLIRSGVEIPPKPDSKLRFGDRLIIVCFEDNLPEAKRVLGDENNMIKTDLLPLFLGIVIGLLIGKISIPIGSTTFSPGTTGGILATAIILGRIGKTGPIMWSLSASSNFMLRQLGLLLFMASVGTKAGSQMMTVIHDNGIVLLFLGVIITIVPMIIGMLIGRLAFKLNFLTIIGVITGGMTSTPGLAAVEPITDTNAPLVAYAAVYPFAMVCMIIFSQIIVSL